RKILYSKTGPCENRNRGAENRWRLLAEMSHQIVFGFAAVAESAHAALPSIITISQNRGDASAREPRTYHGRGFSLLPPRVLALTLQQPGPSPTVRTLWPAADLTKKSVRCYHCRRGKVHGRAS